MVKSQLDGEKIGTSTILAVGRVGSNVNQVLILLLVFYTEIKFCLTNLSRSWLRTVGIVRIFQGFPVYPRIFWVFH